MSDQEPIGLPLVAAQSGVRVTVVRRYLEFGLFEPQSEDDPAAGAGEPRYDPHCAVLVARAERLRQDLDLNYAGAVLVSELLDRIRALEGRG